MSFSWQTEGAKSGTVASGTLLADSGPLAAATHTIMIAVGTTIAGSIVFAWRNEANDADLKAQGFHVDPTIPLIPPAFTFDVPEGQRFVIRTGQIMIGTVQASIFTD